MQEQTLTELAYITLFCIKLDKLDSSFRFSEPPPTIGEMNSMATQSYPVPLKYAVVDGKDVSFYSIFDVQLPTYVER